VATSGELAAMAATPTLPPLLFSGCAQGHRYGIGRVTKRIQAELATDPGPGP